MRPTSQYLADIKTAKQFKYDLSGSTPPVYQSPLFAKKVVLPLEESRGSVAEKKVRAQLVHLANGSNAELCLTVGATQGFFQVLAATTNPGDEVLMEMPIYEPLTVIARFLGLRVRTWNREAKLEDSLKGIRKSLSKRTKAIILTNPHSPSGWTWSPRELDHLCSLGPLVIVNEVYFPLFSNGRLTQRKAGRGNLITIGGLSKAMGLNAPRLGWVWAPKKMRTQVDLSGLILNTDMPTPSLQLGALALSQWKPAMAFYERLHQDGLKMWKRYGTELSRWSSHEFESGYFAMLSVPKKWKTAARVNSILNKKGVNLRDCEVFGANGLRFQILKQDSNVLKCVFEAVTDVYA